MKSFITTLSLITTLAVAGLGFAQTEQANHCKQAREHVNAAVMEGKKGDTKALVQHAEMGLEHAKMAQQPKAVSDVGKAIKSLEETIKQGKAGDANKATEHATESLEYLDAAIGALGG